MILRLVLFFCFSVCYGRDVKICLVLVTQNHDKEILKCLSSVRDFVDAVCVIDQGSQDDTKNIVNQWIHECRFPNFVQDALPDCNPFTLAMEVAQKLVIDSHFVLEDTYFLWMDPMMHLRGNVSGRKEELTHACYAILEHSSSCKYYSFEPHLFLAAIDWTYSDSRPFLWKKDEYLSFARLHDIVLEGGSLSLEKEVERLQLLISKEPEFKDHYFHLAEAYKALGQFSSAIFWYHKRLDLDGDVEEMWFSTLMMASCYEEMGDWGHALSCYLEAFQICPDRPDPIQKISTYYRRVAKPSVSYLFSQHALLVGRSDRQRFFVDPPLSDYQIYEDISIAAYYTRFQKEGFWATSRLAADRTAPWWIRENAHQNQMYYVTRLENSELISLDLDLSSTHGKKQKRYFPASGSIVRTSWGYKLICLGVNYQQQRGKLFYTDDFSGMFRMKSFFVELSPDFQVLSEKEIIEGIVRDRFPTLYVDGPEDCRLFEYQGCDWMSCSMRGFNPIGKRQTVLCRLSNGESSFRLIDRCIPLKTKDSHINEKNWVPFCSGMNLRFIHSYEPLTIATPDLSTGQCSMVHTDTLSWDCSRFRGSAAPIAWDDGYLLLVHEIVAYPDSTRSYLHRFIYLDDQHRMKKMSLPFVFLHHGVERCHGMTMDISGTHLVFVVGSEDKELFLCLTPLETIRGRLEIIK